MITVAAIPRIINLYEAKIDVRPVISKFLGYYVLVALPVITVMALYSVEYTQIFANAKFAEACTLVPFLHLVYFPCYDRLYYTSIPLANKTHIEFIIKLISGIIGIILNVVLIPKMGLIGVGIATLAANFIYFLLSVVIVLPQLNLRFPKNTVLRILICGIPTGLVIYAMKNFGVIPASIQMIVSLVFFYALYVVTKLKVLKESD